MTAGVRVSIGMPVYNGAKWLPSTIRSVLAQTFRDFELVISDNASTDGTEAVCRDFAARDPRVRYSRNAENIGLANNFNRAFQLAQGTYFKWMSCGDLLEPRFVERCVAALDERRELVLVYPATRLFTDDPAVGEDTRDTFDLDTNGPADRFERYTLSAKLNNIMHGLYRTDALGRTKLYRSFLAADYNMIAELILRGRVAQLDEVLNFRRMRPETTTKFLSAEDQRSMYKPKAPGRMKYQEWRRAFDYYAIVLRAPVTLSQQLRLMAFLTRRALWMRHALFEELVHG
jgi:glycosyltransferase involved in cell wall biosynthesis